jgi:hypothetical protein
MADTKPISADQEMSSVWNAMSKGMVRYNDGLMEAEATAEYMQQLAERNVRAIKQSQQPAKKLVK